VDCGSTVSAVAGIAGRELRGGGLAGGGGAAVQQAGAGEREGATADRQRPRARADAGPRLASIAARGGGGTASWPGTVTVSAVVSRARRPGTAVTGAGEPVPFDGWLDLLRVLSELVAATGGENRQVTDSSAQATETSNWH
jgi:hypothetical protein